MGVGPYNTQLCDSGRSLSRQPASRSQISLPKFTDVNTGPSVPRSLQFTAVNFIDWGADGENVHSCEHHAALRRDISAMTIGPQENSPAAAFDVSARR